MDAKIDCNLLTPFPPPLTASSSHLLKSPSSILNISYRITVWQDYRIDLPITSLKTSWAISLSPFFVLQTCSITCIADGCKMQSNVTKWLSLGYSWPSVSTWGSRMVAFKLQKYFDTHWPGKMIIDPRPSFQTVGLNQKSWYLKNVQ